jgi:hypothetical protein
MTDTAEKILMVLHNNNRSVQWLADKLNMNRDSLYYMLHNAKRFPIETYTGICRLFEREGLEFINTISGPKNIRDGALHLGCVTGEELARVNRAIMRALVDNCISETERKEIMDDLRQFLAKVTAELVSIADQMGAKL